LRFGTFGALRRLGRFHPNSGKVCYSREGLFRQCLDEGRAGIQHFGIFRIVQKLGLAVDLCPERLVGVPIAICLDYRLFAAYVKRNLEFKKIGSGIKIPDLRILIIKNPICLFFQRFL